MGHSQHCLRHTLLRKTMLILVSFRSSVATFLGRGLWVSRNMRRLPAVQFLASFRGGCIGCMGRLMGGGLQARLGGWRWRGGWMAWNRWKGAWREGRIWL